MAKLKVFRTSIGFHDAYVAATSQKAALEAWGSEKNLFAMGAAEIVTDRELTEEPLASPGKVIKRTRGSLREHLSAAATTPAPRINRSRSAERSLEVKSRSRTVKPPPPPLRPPPPRPSRGEVDAAQAALKQARSDAKAALAEIDRRQADLRKEREHLEAAQQKSIGKLETQADQAQVRYDHALERWRKI